MKWKDFKIFGVEKEVKDVVGIFYHQDYTNHVVAGYGPSLRALKICSANIPFSVSLSCTHQTHRWSNMHSHIFRAQSLKHVWLCFWLDCWGFYCICFGIGNYTSSSRHSSLVCWKDIWADRTRIALGCFWSGCYHGSKSSWGDDIFWLMFDLCASQFFGFLLDDGFQCHTSYLWAHFVGHCADYWITTTFLFQQLWSPCCCR